MRIIDGPGEEVNSGPKARHRTIDSAIHRVENRTMPSLTANDLKTRGVAAIEEALVQQTEALVSVRGKDKYVVMEVAHYHYLRECELDAALAQSHADIAAGRYVVESAQQHMERVEAMLDVDGAGTPAKKAMLRKVPAKKTATRKAAQRSPRKLTSGLSALDAVPPAADRELPQGRGPVPAAPS